MIISLTGYYGFKNIGDDLMLSNLLQYFSQKKRIKKLFVFVRDNYYQINSRKIKVIPLSKYSRFKKTEAIFKSDLVIWGGGTCIYEETENRGLYDLLRIQKITKLFRKKFIFLGIGIGSLKSEGIINISKKILQNADFIYFRDINSYNSAKKLCHIKNHCVGGDLVFLSKPQKITRDKNSEINNISFSGLYNLSEILVNFYAKELQKISRLFNARIHFLPAHLGEKNDNDFHQKIIKTVPNLNHIIHSWNDPSDFIEILKKMDFHIGLRLHSIILADLLQVPNIGINYSPKVEYYIKKTNLLPAKRLFKIGSKFDTQNIKGIHQQYEFPYKLIENEAKSTLKCLDKFWEMYAK